MDKMDLFIDLGTSSFRAGLGGHNEIISEPSVVAWDGLKRVIIGSEAEQIVGRNPNGVQVVFPIEEGTIKDFDATVEVLKYVANKVIPGRFARRFTLNLSVPSGLTPVEKRAFKEAGQLAGARQVKLLDSIVAAAVGAELPIANPTGCLVINLGAGVTEAAVMSMKGIVDSRRTRIGGRTVDRSIVELLRKEYGFLIGIRSAELLKIRCGDERDTDVFEIRGRSVRTGLPDSLMVPRSLVDDQLKIYYEAIVELIVATLETCPPELVGDIMDRGIVLVGGNANMDDILPSLTRRLEVPIIIAESPETCVIRGLMQAKMRFDTRPSWISRFRPHNSNGIAHNEG